MNGALHAAHWSVIMARGVEGNEMSTPKASQKKQPTPGSQSAKNQKSILGFFQKKSTNSPSPAPSNAAPVETSSIKKTPTSKLATRSLAKPLAVVTPIPSSDAPDYSSPIKQERELIVGRNKENGQSLPILYSISYADRVSLEITGVASGSPSRKACTGPDTMADPTSI